MKEISKGCGCQNGQGHHNLVMRNSELAGQSRYDWLKQDGVHIDLQMLTFMRDAGRTYWGFRFYLLENQDDVTVRRIFAHFGYLGPDADIGAERSMNIELEPATQRMEPFAAPKILVSLAAPTTEETPDGNVSYRILEYAAAIGITGREVDGAITATNSLRLPGNSRMHSRSFWVERRCVAGVDHSRLCVNLPYVYCEARVCSESPQGISCGDWSYEHDGCEPCNL